MVPRALARYRRKISFTVLGTKGSGCVQDVCFGRSMLWLYSAVRTVSLVCRLSQVIFVMVNFFWKSLKVAHSFGESTCPLLSNGGGHVTLFSVII